MFIKEVLYLLLAKVQLVLVVLLDGVLVSNIIILLR